MRRVIPHLPERRAELQTPGTAIGHAGAGQGPAVPVLGEAGAGTTSTLANPAR